MGKNAKVFFWVFCVISLMYQYGLRTSIPSVLNDTLLRNFSITTEELGFTIGSSYFVYMCMQMPVGFLLDRFDNRIFAIFSCVCSSLAIILFIRTDVFCVAYIAQLCLGFSAAFAFPMVVKVAAECFSAKRMTQVTNTALCLSALGPITMSIIVAYFVERYDWRFVITEVSLFGFAISVLLFVFSYKFKSDTQKCEKNADDYVNSFKSDIKALLCDRDFVFVCLYSMFFIGATAAFSDTWGVSFIRKMYGVSRIQATSCVSIQFLGIALGGAIFAYFVKLFGNFKKVMLMGAISIVFLFLLIMFIKVDFFVLKCLIFMLGFCGAAQCLSFPFALKLSPIKSDGFVTGVANTITMIGSTMTIYAVGYLVNLSKTIFNAQNAEYSIEDYRFGFCSLIISAIMSAVMISFVSEKKPK